MTTFDDILNAAKRLSPSDRIRLIDAMRNTLPPEELSEPNDEWITEIQHRSAEFDAGRMAASPWHEVRRRARRKAGLDE